MKSTLWKTLIEQRLTLGGWLHPACVEVVARRASTGCAWTRRMDLSGSFGKTGDFDCTEMGDALDTYKQACRRYRKSTGLYIIRPTQENMKAAIDEDYTLIALGADIAFLADSTKQALRWAQTSMPN